MGLDRRRPGAKYLVDSVLISGKAADAKEYRIETSTDSVTWSAAATAGATGAGRVTTKLASRPSVRYVRMKGVKRSSSNYSYSIYEMEVYGKADVPPPVVLPGKTAFFMPHQNETGYWWQGENARLGSMATAIVMASQAINPLWCLSPADTLSRLAVGSLEWVGGANPLGISLIQGLGPKPSRLHGQGQHRWWHRQWHHIVHRRRIHPHVHALRNPADGTGAGSSSGSPTTPGTCWPRQRSPMPRCAPSMSG